MHLLNLFRDKVQDTEEYIYIHPTMKFTELNQFLVNRFKKLSGSASDKIDKTYWKNLTTKLLKLYSTCGKKRNIFFQRISNNEIAFDDPGHRQEQPKNVDQFRKNRKRKAFDSLGKRQQKRRIKVNNC